jgi:hypothetical protein
VHARWHSGESEPVDAGRSIEPFPSHRAGSKSTPVMSVDTALELSTPASATVCA